MSDYFILQNQHKLFLGKQNTWVDGRDPGALYKTAHKDEAINQKVEASAKDFTQRILLLGCTLNEKGQPQLLPEWLPEPMVVAADSRAPEASQESTISSQDSTPPQGSAPVPPETPAGHQAC